MRWNLRLAAANRGIWTASKLQRMLADAGLVLSAGKMSGLYAVSVPRAVTPQIDEPQVELDLSTCPDELDDGRPLNRWLGLLA